jgi:hypothetical protein
MAEDARMDWETPRFEEIKMDAELSSYVDDLQSDPTTTPDDESA